MNFFLHPVVERVLKSLDRGTAEAMQDCLDGYGSIEADPRGAVLAHLESLREAGRENEFLDLVQAERLATRSLALLDRLQDGMPDVERKLILAAVYYFIVDEDGESDTESVLGLDDDEQVLDVVEKVLEESR
jgi:hypothetical protein